mgnify:CR=1 FL=1
MRAEAVPADVQALLQLPAHRDHHRRHRQPRGHRQAHRGNDEVLLLIVDRQHVRVGQQGKDGQRGQADDGQQGGRCQHARLRRMRHAAEKIKGLDLPAAVLTL